MRMCNIAAVESRLNASRGDPSDLLRRQRAALDPIARSIEAQQAELDGFDAILLAWRRTTAAAALGFIDEIIPKAEVERS